MYAKTRAGLPIDEATFNEEVRKIQASVGRFSSEMESRLIQKLRDGWCGWDDPANAQEIYNIMLAHGAGIPMARGQEVDIANFAMFLWHIRTGHRPPDPEAVGSRARPDTGGGGAAAVLEPIEKQAACR